MDNHCAGRRLSGFFILAEKHVSQQYPKSGTGICLQHIHDGFSGLCRLSGGNGRKNPMIQSVVQKQYLCRLDKNPDQRKYAVFHQKSHSCRQNAENQVHKGSYCQKSEHGQQHPQNAHGKVVNQHFKTCRHMPFHGTVKLFYTESCQRPHNHGCHQHCGVWIAHNSAHYGNCGCHASALAANKPSACKSD